jgi:hypothetical protein
MNVSLYNKNFLKDLKLPVAVDVDPYFSHLMALIDPYYQSFEKYDIFQRTFNDFGGEKVFDYNRQVVNATLDYVKDKPEYAAFNTLDMNQFKKEISIQAKELYKSPNAGKTFISIDLVKANFQSFMFVNPEIFDGHTTYNDFALSRGFNEYMLISKQIRQILFGNLNPQRQQKIQYYMMNLIAERVMAVGVDVKSVYSLSSDELVFEKEGHSLNLIKEAIAPLGFSVRVEEFVLDRPFNKPFFVKRLSNGTVDFKMVPTSVMAEFIKRLEGRELEDLDMYFYDETKRLAKYVSPCIE